MQGDSIRSGGRPENKGPSWLRGPGGAAGLGGRILPAPSSQAWGWGRMHPVYPAQPPGRWEAATDHLTQAAEGTITARPTRLSRDL